MARLARVVLAGYPHHVTQRGVRSMPVFFSDQDRHQYLKFMKEQGQRFGLKFLSYCLMSNHIHLICVPTEVRALSHAIGEAHRRHTRMINLREGVKGYLFQGRFFSCPLDERHLLAGVPYVERNPVRAGITKFAWEYPWSSAGYHVGVRNGDPLVDDTDLFGLVSSWREFLQSDPDEIDFLRVRTRTGRPCGNDQFMRKAESLAGRKLEPLEGGRPRKGN